MGDVVPSVPVIIFADNTFNGIVVSLKHVLLNVLPFSFSGN